MENGRVAEEGQFQALMAKDQGFAHLMKAHTLHDHKDSEEVLMKLNGM